MNTYIVLAIAAAVIISGGIAAVVLLQTNDDMMQPPMDDTMSGEMTDTMEDTMDDTMTDTMDDTMMDNMEIRTIDVGVMLPATGDIASHGQDSRIAVELAADDFNAYLEQQDADWRVNLIVEDTQTDPIVALEKIQSLNAKGVNFILGTQSSAELRNIKPYADSNGIILLSPSSTSPKLALVDTIFRLVPDDTQQGIVIGRLLAHYGIEVVIPIYRADVWGDGLYESSRQNSEDMGIIVDEGIRYSPEITVFSSEADLLNGKVTQYLDAGHDIQNIAVLMISFSEAVHLLNSASAYDTLAQTTWFGSDASSNDDAITGDPIAAQFVADVGLITTQFAPSDNEKYEHVKAHLENVIGSAPSNYAYSAYDSLWVLGLAIEQTGSTDTDLLVGAIPGVAANHVGAIGTIVFNEYGDLAISDYDLWHVSDGEWANIGRHSADTGEIMIYDAMNP